MNQPAPIRAAQRRSTSRIGADNGAYALITLGEAVVRRPILDIAGNGIGLVLEPTDAVAPGETIDRVRFLLPVGAALMAGGLVKHLRVGPGSSRTAGIELEGLSAADQKRLEAWVRGQSGARARDRRSFSAAGPVSVEFTTSDGRVRARPVMLLHTRGCELGLDRADGDLAEGSVLSPIIVHFDGEPVLTTPGEVQELLRHRGRSVRALVEFTALDLAGRRRLSRLLATAGAAAAR